MSIRVGTEVSWKWGSSQASGKVTEWRVNMRINFVLD